MSVYEVAKNRLALRLKRLAGSHRLGNITKTEMESTRTLEIQKAWQFLESLRYIPTELKGITFFGLHDWWIYHKSYHPNMCRLCDFYGDMGFFNGTDLRRTFPRLTIDDEDTIEPNVHPHCGCSLSRVTEHEA